MYYEFYLDVYFLENLIMNYLILSMTGRVMKCRCARRKMAVSALLGAVGACAVAVLPVHRMVFLSVLLSFLLGGAMVLASYGIHGYHTAMRTIMVFYFLALLLAGVWQLLMHYLHMAFLCSMFAGYAIVWMGVEVWRRIKNKTQFLYDVTIAKGGRTVNIKGFLDSGNQLVMPVTGKPVQVVDLEAIGRLLSREEMEELERMIRMETTGESSGGFTYIPYHSIGREQGIMPVMILDEVYIKHGESAWNTKKVAAAISKTAVSGRGEYQMILHPQILE